MLFGEIDDKRLNIPHTGLYYFKCFFSLFFNRLQEKEENKEEWGL